MRPVLSILALSLLLPAAAARAQTTTIDLAATSTAGGTLLRLHGSSGTGVSGVPVAGGFDLDGDGHADLALAAMRASPFGREAAGEVFLFFGDGTVAGDFDTAVANPRLLRVVGDGPRENAGSEIWIDDVTGDGLGDLLICRQNFAPTPARTGAGALTVIAGSPALRDLAAAAVTLDLRSPPPEATITHVVGRGQTDRLCIWARTGDATGDGVADVAIGSDQEDQPGAVHGGAVYLVRGGAHLASGQTYDLASFGAGDLAGHVLRVTAPAGGREHHLGGTVQLADLDGNGRAELLAAATINRAGAVLPADGAPAGSAHGTGGTRDGTLYVVWDDAYPDPWPAGFTFAVDAPPGGLTVIDGGDANVSFGEEILGGLDYDGDGLADLFAGDLTATAAGRRFAGLGHVFYRAVELRGRVFDLEAVPAALATPTTFLGPEAGAIAADTAIHGDFDFDGVADLAFSSPHANPQGRPSAGILHVVHGRAGGWPEVVDLAAPVGARITDVHGARGRDGADRGDTLGYSGTAGDVDGDGRIDLISNEMLGNGLAPGTIDVGNLIVLSGVAFGIFADGFESGDAGRWPKAVGLAGPAGLVGLPLPWP